MKHITNINQIPSNTEKLFKVYNVGGTKWLETWEGIPFLNIYERKGDTSLNGTMWVNTSTGMQNLEDAGVTETPYNKHRLFLNLGDALEYTNS